MTPSLTIGIDARKLRDFGIGRHIEGLLRGFANADTEDRFVVFGPEWIEEHPVWRELPAARFRHVRCDAPLYSIQELFAFRGMGRRHGLDVLHFPHYVRAIAPGCAVAVTIHDTIHLDFPPSRRARAYAWGMMRWAVRSAQTLFTVSHAARADLIRCFGSRAERAIVTPNAVGPGFRPPSPESMRFFRDHRGLTAPFVVMPSSHRPHKNVRGGLEAFRAGAPPDWELILPARDASAAARLAALADSKRRFRVLPDVTDEDLRLLDASAEFVLVPSLAEGFGLPALEALAVGGAALVTPIAPHLEILGDAAEFSRSASTADLTEAVRGLAHDPARRARLRAEGPPRAARFDWGRTAQLTLQGYRDAAFEPPRSR